MNIYSHRISYIIYIHRCYLYPATVNIVNIDERRSSFSWELTLTQNSATSWFIDPTFTYKQTKWAKLFWNGTPADYLRFHLGHKYTTKTATGTVCKRHIIQKRKVILRLSISQNSCIFEFIRIAKLSPSKTLTGLFKVQSVMAI